MDERGRIALLSQVLAGGETTGVVELGIGDDAALLHVDGARVACSVDVAVDGVHFRREWMSWEGIGFRATMAAASDLAAMAATPLALLSSLVLPADVDDGALEGMARGQREACDVLGSSVVGGNLSRGAELSLTTTVLGVVERPLRRDSAEPGDVVWVCGEIGMAGAGLATLLAGRQNETGAPAAALEAWRRPRARIAEALQAAVCARCGIDISDGLAADAMHVAEASGVSIVLDASRLISGELARAARFLDCDPLELALSGGEDYALLVAAPPGIDLTGFERIGRVRQQDDFPLWLERADRVVRVEARGFDHFR